VLGLLGFLIVFGAFVFLGPLRAFVNSDEGPLKASLVAAMALPVLRQLFQFIHSRRSTTAKRPSIRRAGPERE
jgi:hypothetical protein